MKQFLYKVPNGKLLKIKIEIVNRQIKDIQILGDFFLYPEEKLAIIERALIGKRKDEILDVLNNIVKKEHILLVGFSIDDLNSLIQRAFDDEMETDS